MKKILLLSIIAVLGITTANAGKPKQPVSHVNPRGLFRLQKIDFENGSAANENPGSMYWFCGDSLALHLKVIRTFNDNPTIEMKDINGEPLNYTGYQKKNKKFQVYNTTNDSFTLRWYNDEVKNDIFPYNAYCVESYSRDSIQPNVAKAFDMLQMKFGDKPNKFTGVWKRRGLQMHEIAGKDDKVYGVDQMYKIYSPDKVMVLYNISDAQGTERAVCEMADVKYYDDNTLKEEFVKDGNSCIIFWLNDDTFTLTFIKYGSPMTEVWDRCGLPSTFQTLFGTSIPITDKKPSVLTE